MRLLGVLNITPGTTLKTTFYCTHGEGSARCLVGGWLSILYHRRGYE